VMSESTMRYDPENDIFSTSMRTGAGAPTSVHATSHWRKTRSGHIEARSNQSEWPIQ
jgi:hypothetical protein